MLKSFLLIFALLILAILTTSCSKDLKKIEREQVVSAMTPQDRKVLQAAVLSLDSDLLNRTSLIALTSSQSNFQKALSALQNSGAQILYSDTQIGYINFKATTPSSIQTTLDLVDSSAFESAKLDESLILNDQDDGLNLVPDSPIYSRATTPRDLYPTVLMNVDQLQKEFYEQYGKELDGSLSTVVIVDTGLDISRTDAFQDRIVALRSLRETDVAKLKVAKEVEIDGKIYLTAKINKMEVSIEKTSRLSADRTYYLGYFTEKQFALPSKGYSNYDFNQDGLDEGVFPIVAYKNDEGQFEVYINVNSNLTYKELGDQSIEDEILLMDFNWVAKNISNRYSLDAKAPVKSSYKFTTPMDILKGDKLLKARTKGLVNLAVTVEKGFELDEQGDLVKLSDDEEEAVYGIGIVGFDINGHGTHCAGIAAGHFNTANEFSGSAYNAKIIGASYLGGPATQATLNNFILHVIKNYKNVIFNFSFGGDTPLNSTQGQVAAFYDRVAAQYGTVFVKSAGNSGPGLNSHGVTVAKNMISVGNYYSNVSRETYSSGNFDEEGYLLTWHSSRGPMIDGALKPDIGAPGWVMSSVPFSKPLGELENGSFQYWSGTSMAAPNTVGVVALLYDASLKSGLVEETQELSPVSVDKVFQAIWNSALPYSTFKMAECFPTELGHGACELVSQNKGFTWTEGGAGRINALGAWEVLQTLIDTPKYFYKLETRSMVKEFYQKANGYYHFVDDEIPAAIDFELSFSPEVEVANIADHQKLRLVIDPQVDWLSFDAAFDKKERIIDLFGAQKTSLRVYVSKQKLVENGKMRPGLFTTQIKAFEYSDNDYFRFVIPVTMIGPHTSFNPNTDSRLFSVRGFVQSDQFVRYFLPVKKKGDSLVVDLSVAGVNPGEVKMQIFHQGIQVNSEKLMATSSLDSGHGRNSVHYVVQNAGPGMYEIVLVADRNSREKFEGKLGSFFQLDVSQISLDIEDVELQERGDYYHVNLNQISNPGSVIRIADASVEATGLRNKSVIGLKQSDSKGIRLMIVSGFKGFKVKTSYPGDKDGVDIDLILLDDKGQPVAESGGPDSTESLEYFGAKGTYTLVFKGFSIPDELELDFNVEIDMIFSKPIVLVNEFKGPVESLILKKDFTFFNFYRFSATSRFKKEQMDLIPSVEGFTPIIGVSIKAFNGNRDDDISEIFNYKL